MKFVSFLLLSFATVFGSRVLIDRMLPSIFTAIGASLLVVYLYFRSIGLTSDTGGYTERAVLVRKLNILIAAVGMLLIAITIIVIFILPSTLGLLPKVIFVRNMTLGISYIIGSTLILARWYEVPSKIIKP